MEFIIPVGGSSGSGGGSSSGSASTFIFDSFIMYGMRLRRDENNEKVTMVVTKIDSRSLAYKVSIVVSGDLESMLQCTYGRHKSNDIRSLKAPLIESGSGGGEGGEGGEGGDDGAPAMPRGEFSGKLGYGTDDGGSGSGSSEGSGKYIYCHQVAAYTSVDRKKKLDYGGRVTLVKAGTKIEDATIEGYLYSMWV